MSSKAVQLPRLIFYKKRESSNLSRILPLIGKKGGIIMNTSTFQRTIQKQDTIVTVNGTSRIAGGFEGDLVNIDTVIHLTSPSWE
jgi:hypothetical protein